MSNKKRNIVNRNMTEIKSGKYVQIGEELAHDTEYVGDILSTYSEDGKIFSGVAGILKVNKKKRKISVKSYNDDKRSTPKKGDWIIGTIDYIRKYSLGVNVNVLITDC